MIQMRVGQQHIVDARSIKAESLGVFIFQLAATLI